VKARASQSPELHAESTVTLAAVLVWTLPGPHERVGDCRVTWHIESSTTPSDNVWVSSRFGHVSERAISSGSCQPPSGTALFPSIPGIPHCTWGAIMTTISIMTILKHWKFFAQTKDFLRERYSVIVHHEA